jgi:hypothetical protein
MFHQFKCVITLLSFVCVRGAFNEISSVVDVHDNDIRPAILRSVIGVKDTNVAQRDDTLFHRCKFTVDRYVKGLHIVTLVWMSQEHSNSFGKFFTKVLRDFQDAIITLVRNDFDKITALPPDSVLFCCGILTFIKQFEPPARNIFFVPNPNPTRCVHSSNEFYNTSLDNGFFFRLTFSAKDIADQTVLIGVKLTIDHIERQLEEENGNDAGLVFDCDTECTVTTYKILESPKMFRCATQTVECYICSVLHSVEDHRGTRHLDVVHYPACSTRMGEETLVRGSEGQTARAVVHFDLPTAKDQSHFIDRHKCIVTDLFVTCWKEDNLTIVNDDVVPSNNSHKINIQSKLEELPNSIRVFVNVKIDNVDADDYGDYVCQLKCIFGSHVEPNSHEFSQLRRFSIIAHDWKTKEVLMTLNHSKQLNELWVIILVFLVSTVIIFLCYITNKARKYLLKRKRRMDISLVDSVLKAVRENLNTRILKYDVFLSYSSADRDWVRTVYEFLIDKGYRVCFDEVDFPPGCYIPTAIADAVSGSEKVIAIVSPNYVNSGWTELEYVLSITQIMNKEAPEDSLLPILYKPCKMPLALKRFKYINYTSFSVGTSKSWERFYEKLLGIFCRQNNQVSSTVSDKIFKTELLRYLGEPTVQPAKD